VPKIVPMSGPARAAEPALTATSPTNVPDFVLSTMTGGLSSMVALAISAHSDTTANTSLVVDISVDLILKAS